ncbi:hypothetical protein B0T10DRAFT_609642 [Thelonectria olida]|uniref:DUF676 domain-containing protein n=1 Tax=Thelonectria olida TaxID=1576542 RepID=A0A9P8VVJ2_9HYPO|nr:hypothetical protein B0T10DRAFT_609642 [Thelonectria olida]
MPNIFLRGMECLSDKMAKFWPQRQMKAASEEKYGIMAWTEPQGAIVDIVFIHGLRGHRERTWTVKNGSGFWPRDFLALEIPEARILTYGYDANIIRADSPISNSRLGEHAQNFLSALATYREKGQNNERPIIFVAHSLGGLVCEDALVTSRASAEEHLKQISRCTRGIAFLGTPHSGTDLAASVDRIVQWIANTRQVNTRVAKVLSRDSEVLSRVQSGFHSLLESRTNEELPKVSITCFYEELPIPRFREVVPKSSAILPAYPAIGIHCDHRDMAKFTSPTDPGFLSVLNELLRWINDIRSDLGEINRFAEQPREQCHGGIALGGITICGSVVQSSIVNGSQVIHGNLVFG